MKNNKKIDNKTVHEIESFINEEILASRIWIFSGIAISILLCMILKNYMIFELANIIQSLRKLKLPDGKGILFIILFILEILLSFVLPKILINKQKKNMKSALIVLSLIKGLILSIFFGKLSFFVTQKTIIAGIMLVLALILLVFLIKKDIKNIQIKILKKVETDSTEILEKTRFFSVVVLYSDIVKVVILYLLLMLIIR
ncbi:hypothetical protein [Leptotrichia buccalis]|uniref:Uncharacterized protein n=1 Tax=Leptotrichia buccalis (strain ATCC 14201 / DSM 1135 / JCM 12969 / NCTC 10249 / C-1013-b) TaxID=523794 RepID=C7ND17_LEPBD|nr:hypothetical protein [Leptotrichia buccalis]ACV38087.1 hypothetical protein Lebu_0159 [Leptotrichia buccalis C-1013-b]